MAELDLEFYRQSLTQQAWPEERLVTRLCNKCGDSLQLDLPRDSYNEIIQHLREGYFRTESKNTDYHKLLDDAQSDWDHCQGELTRLRELCTVIEGYQNALQLYMASIRSLRSPIHMLPPEILTEIFEYVCCGQTGTNHYDFAHDYRLPTIILSRVCSRWHNLVTSMPVLWSSFGFRQFYGISSAPAQRLFTMFLERSHQHPIDFSVRLDTRSLSLSSLIPTTNVERWRNVEIGLPRFSVVEEFLQPLIEGGRDFTGLESLFLDSPYEEVEEGPLVCSLACPRLHSMTLRGSPLLLEPSCPSLRYLTLDMFTAREVLHVIIRCPELRTLALRNLVKPHAVSTVTNDQETLTVINCSAQKLHFHLDNEPEVGGELFRYLRLPQLTHLVLSDAELGLSQFDDRLPEDFDIFCSVIETPTITRLTLRSISFTSTQILRFFQSLPSVDTLEVKESSEDSSGLDLIIKSLIFPQWRNGEGGQEGAGEGGGAEEVERENNSLGTKLNSGNNEEDTLTPKGVWLLPKLKVLDLTFQRPHPSRILELRLVQLVRSRWKPSSLTSTSSAQSGSLPGDLDNGTAVACLQKLCLRHSDEDSQSRIESLEQMLELFKEEGMDIDMIKLQPDAFE